MVPVSGRLSLYVSRPFSHSFLLPSFFLCFMELALSLGDTPPRPAPFTFRKKSSHGVLDLGFCMSVENGEDGDGEDNNGGMGTEQPVQLDLLPLSSNHQAQDSQIKFPFTWLEQKYDSDRICDSNMREEVDEEVGGSLSSPNSSASPFRMEFSIFTGAKSMEGEAERGTSSRGSDEEENGMMRKKLRLTKEQSAFLEESFKEHNTLNPKQKLALAKQLNLRPRQVEVWFQNRRARTKLKQTEVDCEYLKRCCETLTEENKRLRKEVQELRALKAAKPFYMQLPATTLTMCPSCERVATNNNGGAAANSNALAPVTQQGGALVQNVSREV